MTDELPEHPAFIGELVHVSEDDANGRKVCRVGLVLELGWTATPFGGVAGAGGDVPSIRARISRPTNAVGLPVGHWDGEAWYVEWHDPSTHGAGYIIDATPRNVRARLALTGPVAHG